MVKCRELHKVSNVEFRGRRVWAEVFPTELVGRRDRSLSMPRYRCRASAQGHRPVHFAICTNKRYMLGVRNS